jgi:thioredoxin-dependent peroxiredoxin
VVLGVSGDTQSAQSKFAEKFDLPYRLLCDTEHEVAQKYGVWVEKMNYGKTYMGIDRTTFVIGTDGRIARVFEKVKPEGHAGEVLAAMGA